MFSAKESSGERVRDLQENLHLHLRRHDDDTTAAAAGEEAGSGSLPSFGAWIATVSSLSLAGMFAVTGAVFAVANVVRDSAELVFGFAGLVVWNALGGVCALVAVLSWSAQFSTKFRHNVMTREELRQHWVSEHRACLGRSFYLVVAALLLFALNVALLGLIMKQPWVARRLRRGLRKKLTRTSFGPKQPQEIFMSV